MYLLILGLTKYDAYLPFVSPNWGSLVITEAVGGKVRGVTLAIPPLIKKILIMGI